MKKKLEITYDLVKDDGSKEEVTREVKVPDKPPMSFFAGAQPLVTIQHLEKVAMAEYIAELENTVDELSRELCSIEPS